MSVQLPLGLLLAFLSAVGVNWAYAREHDAVSAMPAFTVRHPVRFVLLLLSNRGWLVGFGTETAGWLLYVAALRLAPISVVQAVCASGIAVLAFITAKGHPGRLALPERLAVAVAFAGLVMLSLSLVDSGQTDHVPTTGEAVLWLGSLTGVGLLLAASGFGLARAPALGLAAGTLFAGGDISAKLVVFGGVWLAALVPLVVCYMLGTSLLQGGFQHGDALVPAGLATLATNAIPIAAGFLVFAERLPYGLRGALQITAFVSLVVSAALLAQVSRPSQSEADPGRETSTAARSESSPMAPPRARRRPEVATRKR
jgi:hypothetical protein